MPRIDPKQLLTCLGVLLSPNGGIKSKEEVQRLASLMTKFSKKLVSKCIYIQILKCTEGELLGLFMGSGGWRLAHMWLTESLCSKNLPLVKELLELLLLCPVDIERLKSNNCPKLVKELSKDESNAAVKALASKLVERWLKTVKGEAVLSITIDDIPKIIEEGISEAQEAHIIKEEPIENHHDSETKGIKQEQLTHNTESTAIKIETKTDIKEDEKVNDALPILKISLKDGKQVVSKVEDSEIKKESKSSRSKDRRTSDGRESSKSSSKHSSSSHSLSSKSSKDKHKSRSSSSSSSKSSSSKHKSKDKERESHSSSKHRESSSKKSDKSSSRYDKKDDRKSTKDDKSLKNSKESSSSSKEQQDKNKETLEKLQPPSINKLGKIPKLSDTKKEAPSISIEVRKPNDPNRPKTVKTFHSKFRSHGLEEEVKPPPSRASVLKKPPADRPVLTPLSMPKRPSPVHNEGPPEKKPKTIEPVEKPGSIKLIPAKPKPILLESDMFMDALNASATNKKEPKKRKRRTSGSKDGNAPNDPSPPSTPSNITSPTQNKSTPLRFYQDTLDTDDAKDKPEKPEKLEKVEKDADPEPNEKSPSPDKNSSDKETEEKIEQPIEERIVNGLKSVLCYHKKKGPKKSIKWKPDGELEEIQYFELDETERVNVTKTFMDMKHQERVHEREAFQKARNLSNDDTMEEKTNWRPLILLDIEGQIPVDYGKNSKEKDVQAIRQRGILQSLYFHKSMIPDSATEPTPETHPHTDPVSIPLDDITGNQDNVSDYRNIPWPEPKGNPPPAGVNNMTMPTIFPPAIAPFPGAFPTAQFPVPAFQGVPGMLPGPEWQNGMPVMGPGGMPGPMPPGPIGPGAMAAAGMPPGMMMTPDMFPGQMFPGPMQPEAFGMIDNMNGGPNMFPPEFMQGPPGPDNYGYANRGAMRGRGSSWRGKGPSGSWDGPRGRPGGPPRGTGRKTVCMYFQKKGSCRQGDKCTFLHPGVNCPY